LNCTKNIIEPTYWDIKIPALNFPIKFEL